MDGMQRCLTFAEMLDIKNVILKINQVQTNYYFDSVKPKNLIEEINNKHPEIIMVYNIVSGLRSCGNGNNSCVLLQDANEWQLRQDLEWKKRYLLLKLEGKTIDEIINEY